MKKFFKKQKKGISLILSVALLASTLLFSQTFAIGATYSGDLTDTITWTFDDATGLLSFSGTGDMPNYTTDTYADVPWYSHVDSITEIDIGDGITTVGVYEFFKHNKVKTLKMADSVVLIGEKAFYYNSITSLIFSKNLKSIGSYAFSNIRMTELYLPEGIETVGDYIFSESALLYIYIPSTLKYCTSKSFIAGGLYGLKEINVDENNPYYSSLDGVLFNKDKTTLLTFPTHYKSAQNNTDVSYEIPYGVEIIGDSVFAGSLLSHITIPNTVTKIGDYCFASSHIQEFDIPDSVQTIGRSTFESAFAKSVSIGNGITELPLYCFKSSYIENISLPDSLTTIGDECFRFCRHLKSIDIPDKVSLIPKYCFNYCEKLVTVDFPASLETIDENAFAQCFELTNFVLPKKLKTIKYAAFIHCESLTTIHVPKNVETIGHIAFANNPTLGSVYFYNKNVSISSSLFNTDEVIKTIYGYSNSQAEKMAFAEGMIFSELVCDHYDTVSTHQDATCTENGFDKTICYYCDEVLSTTQVEATGHSYTSTVVPPTSTEQGCTINVCDVCGDTYYSDYIDKIATDVEPEVNIVSADSTVVAPNEKEIENSSILENVSFNLTPGINSCKIQLDFNTNNKIEGYYIYIKSNNEKNYRSIAKAENEYVIITNLQKNNVYSFKVIPYYLCQNSKEKLYQVSTIKSVRV